MCNCSELACHLFPAMKKDITVSKQDQRRRKVSICHLSLFDSLFRGGNCLTWNVLGNSRGILALLLEVSVELNWKC